MNTQKQINARLQARQAYPVNKPCEVCGQIKGVHRHHDNYDYPLVIRFLCPKHHKQAHPTALNRGSGNLTAAIVKGAWKPDPAILQILVKRNSRLNTIMRREFKKISWDDVDYIQGL